MPSSATARNRLEKQAQGENENTWGDRFNTNFADLLDDALDGMVSFTLSTTKTLTDEDFAEDEARHRYLNITGGTGGTVTIPNVEKLYFVRNATSGNVIFTTGSGTTTTVSSGGRLWIVCEGGNVVRQELIPVTAGGTGATTAADARTNLGLGTAAVVNTGTSGATVPLLDGANTHSGLSIFTGGFQISAASPTLSIIDSDSTTSAAQGIIRFRDQAGTDEATIQKPSGATTLTFNLTGTLGLTISATAVSPVSSTTASAANVFQSASGTALLRSTSARRYKTDIQDIPLEECIRIVRALRAVSYVSKVAADNEARDGARFFGCIAEEAARVSHHLVHWLLIPNAEIVRDNRGWVAVDGDLIEPEVCIETRDGVLVPDGVMYDRIAAINVKVTAHTLDRLDALEAA